MAEMFVSQVNRYGNRVLYRFARGNDWYSYSWREVLSQVREIALGLVSLGVKKGDRVGILSANRVEWSLIDWANICIGALSVPLYPTSTSSEISRIFEHSAATFLFVDTLERWGKLDPFHPSLCLMKGMVLIEPAKDRIHTIPELKVVRSLDELRGLGRRYAEGHKDSFDHLVSSLRSEDDLTIIYTSGTTGEPKGVLTTHGHYLFMIYACGKALASSDQEVVLQFLPFAHSFGRLEHFMVVAEGYTCGFARSMETVAKDLLVIRPTLLFSVPRMYENAYNRIRSRVTMSGVVRRSLFHWAISVGRRSSRYHRQRVKAPWSLRAARYLAHRLVFSRIHQGFGGRLKVAVSGGAPLAYEIAEFFHSVGILILEGYGLTETSTVSHVNRMEHYEFDTVGVPLEGVECRIAPDGEILLRGANVFKGYYQDSKATREVLGADGWFHTGDVGEINQEGFLRITDRKKDLIVTSGGKNVAPQMIENLLKTDPLINQVVVLGDRNSHLIALVTLNQDQIMEWGKREELELHSAEEAAHHPRVISLVKEKIRQKNRDLAPYEAIRNFRILPQEFTLGAGELTPSLKLRRKIVLERYRDTIEDMARRPRFDL